MATNRILDGLADRLERESRIRLYAKRAQRGADLFTGILRRPPEVPMVPTCRVLLRSQPSFVDDDELGDILARLADAS